VRAARVAALRRPPRRLPRRTAPRRAAPRRAAPPAERPRPARRAGFNNAGQLGMGNTASLGAPAPVSTAGTTATWSNIAAAGFHTCAISAAAGPPPGAVWCWGERPAALSILFSPFALLTAPPPPAQVATITARWAPPPP
jgi:hypothetical protein